MTLTNSKTAVFFLICAVFKPIFGVELSKVTHLNPMSLLSDPYETNQVDLNAPELKNQVCALKIGHDKMSYSTYTFATKAEAQRQNAILTHTGPCGACSSLQDLQVYLTKPDLTKPGKKCASIFWLKDSSIHCFEKLGFSKPCAEIWFYNAKNTAKKCFWTCVKSTLARENSNPEKGVLNACLQCDEDKSGPIFKHYAGRNRRNSGLLSSIGRPESEIDNISHDYLKLFANPQSLIQQGP